MDLVSGFFSASCGEEEEIGLLQAALEGPCRRCKRRVFQRADIARDEQGGGFKVAALLRKHCGTPALPDSLALYLIDR